MPVRLNEVRMKLCEVALCSVLLTHGLWAGQIFGTIRENKQPFANKDIVVQCVAGGQFSAKTDAAGSYRVNITSEGQCDFLINPYKAKIVSYQTPTRYDFDVVPPKDLVRK